MNDNNNVPQNEQPQQNQQQQFQQQFQQNVNPHQYQQGQYCKKSIIESMACLLPKLVLVFLIIGCAAVAYDLIKGIVHASKESYGSFTIFLNYFIRAISDGARYLFYSIVALGVNKIVNK